MIVKNNKKVVGVLDEEKLTITTSDLELSFIWDDLSENGLKLLGPGEAAEDSPGGDVEETKRLSQETLPAAMTLIGSYGYEFADRATKQEVEYEERATKKDKCRECQYYLNQACYAVEGKIAPAAWCNQFYEST